MDRRSPGIKQPGQARLPQLHGLFVASCTASRRMGQEWLRPTSNLHSQPRAYLMPPIPSVRSPSPVPSGPSPAVHSGGFLGPNPMQGAQGSLEGWTRARRLCAWRQFQGAFVSYCFMCPRTKICGRFMLGRVLFWPLSCIVGPA